MRALLPAAWALLAAAFLALLLLHRAQARRPGVRTDVASAFFQDLIRYGKTKRGGGQHAGWLRRLQVPKSTEPAILLAEKIMKLTADSERFSALLVLLLLWLHSFQRLAECLYTSVFSNGVIHIVQYCFGIGYYIAVGSTVLCQVPTNARNGQELSVQILWYHIVGIVMYIWASLHQHRCLVILANLRKSKSGKVLSLNHSIPFGDWFERVSCPHYFAELLIYISMAITFGFHNVTWWFVVMYVFFNQALAAVLCHEFYQEKFTSYPKHRKAFVPFIF
ncbi:hypothetical protein ASZ78_001708 [Callipepla squamata]|uniref:Polyprenal reductase n=1 Tax=Callipepla squamata TaxID=9009 RepID=A0A226MHA7_CALSU|nr:hypothetical protein ASZ78_001708 [Callipepla squamata]